MGDEKNPRFSRVKGKIMSGESFLESNYYSFWAKRRQTEVHVASVTRLILLIGVASVTLHVASVTV